MRRVLAGAGAVGRILQPVFCALGILCGWSQFINRLLIIYGQVFAGPLQEPQQTSKIIQLSSFAIHLFLHAFS